MSNMAYVPYVTPEYYKETYKGSVVPDAGLEKALRQASRLTLNMRTQIALVSKCASGIKVAR